MEPSLHLEPDVQTIFADEAERRLTNLATGLWQLEVGKTDDRLIDLLLLDAHALKGAAAVLWFDDVARVAHALGEVLSTMGDTSQARTPAVIRTMREALDSLRVMIGDLLAGNDIGRRAAICEATLLGVAGAPASAWPPLAPEATTRPASPPPFDPPFRAPASPNEPPRSPPLSPESPSGGPPGPAAPPSSPEAQESSTAPAPGHDAAPTPDTPETAHTTETTNTPETTHPDTPAVVVEFRTSAGVFAIPVEAVRVVKAVSSVTPRPNSAAEIIGVLDHEGVTIPVLSALGGGSRHVLVMAADERLFGLVVDRVLGLSLVPAGEQPASLIDPGDLAKALEW